MDDQIEHQRLQEEAEFWEERQREEAQERRSREGGSGKGTSAVDPLAVPPVQPVRDEPYRDPLLERRDHFQKDAPTSADRRAASGNMVSNPSKKSSPARTRMLTVVAALVLAALAYQGYKAWAKKENQAEALAQPETGAAPLPAIVEGQPPLPAVVPGAPIVEPVVIPEPVVPVGPTEAEIAINARLDRLEARLDQVIEGLRAQGYIVGDAGVGGTPIDPTSFAPYKRVVQPAPAARRATQRAPIKREPAPKPILTQQRVLSVDMWNGEPSVVLSQDSGTASKVQVLAIGDSFEGITLKSVNVRRQTATFSDGVRSVTVNVDQ